VSDSRSHPTGNESLLPGNWKELAPLVDAVLDAPPERRSAVLTELSAGDPGRRAALERLVAECERDMPLLNRPAAERFDYLLDAASETPDVPLPDTLGGRYRIEREIGRGGMARVFLAHDDKHARDVAVKVIRPEFAASLGRERFLREISIAARLRHPNIVPLYDSGDADGVLYFVMPYEAGPSLRTRLGRGDPVPLNECVSVLRDVARALAYAHEQGLVHRDVKPDNVMLSGGAAVVTDFGIAKAVSVAQNAGASSTLTQSGAGIGTPAYMAPEQAVGDPSTDHRADIYSFGCLAYELLTGKPPFHGLPSHQIIAAHVGTKPAPITKTDVPDAIARLVARCLEKQPDARPQSAQEIVAELESVSTATREPLAPRRRLTRAESMALLAVGVVFIIGAGYFASSRAQSPAPQIGELTLAVLPLRSLGGDSLQNDMAGGLSDEIAAKLKIPGVRVLSRRGAGKYSGQRDIDLAKTGRELGARFLVMGSLRSGARLSVTARLVDTDDSSDLWSDVIDQNEGDYSAVREDIIRSIEQAFRTKFGSATDASRIAQKPGRTPHPEAYRLFLLAQGVINKRGGFPPALAMFRRATELDTLFADAFSGLSVALALTTYFQRTPASQVADEVTRTAERALRLDPSLAGPHVALGLVYEHNYEWRRAQTEFETAVRLRRPADVEPLVQYGRILSQVGRLDEALKQLLMARDVEPASSLVLGHLSFVYYLLGQMDSAVVESERAFQSDSLVLTTLTLGALVRLKAGRRAEAVGLALRAPPTGGSNGGIYVLAAAGDTVVAMARLRALESIRPPVWMLETARFTAMLGVGDTARALDALERATAAKEIWPSTWPIFSPAFDPIRGSERFQKILQEIGLPSVASSGVTGGSRLGRDSAKARVP